MKNAFTNAAGVLTSWGYAEANGTDTLVKVPDDFNSAPGSVQYVNGAWAPYAPPPTVAAYEAALQTALDEGAQAWGYDSIVSAASYAASTNAQFKAEAVALVGWRDAVWLWAAAQLAAVQGGTQAMPATPAAFVALMPAQPVRPKAS